MGFFPRARYKMTRVKALAHQTALHVDKAHQNGVYLTR
jgi:hypothetical protein